MIIYICGPYRSRWGLPGILWHIYKARRAAVRLSEKGYVVFTPHLNWGLFDGHQPDKFWLGCGLAMLVKCDTIFLLKGWHKSKGSLAEVNKALDLKLEIVHEGELR